MLVGRWGVIQKRINYRMTYLIFLAFHTNDFFFLTLNAANDSSCAALR
jgi:hypothetical protein